jgi:hypothetical protein
MPKQTKSTSNQILAQGYREEEGDKKQEKKICVCERKIKNG